MAMKPKANFRRDLSEKGAGTSSSWSRNLNTNDMMISGSSNGMHLNTNTQAVLHQNLHGYFPEEFEDKFTRESIRHQLKGYVQETKKGLSSSNAAKIGQVSPKHTNSPKESHVQKEKKKHKKSDSIGVEKRVFPLSASKSREKVNLSQKLSPRTISEINGNMSSHESYLHTPNERVHSAYYVDRSHRSHQETGGQNIYLQEMNGSFTRNRPKCECNHCSGICSCGYRSDSTQIIEGHVQTNRDFDCRAKLENFRNKKKHYKKLFIQEKSRADVLEAKLEEQISIHRHTEGRLREALEIHREDEVVNADVVELREELRRMDELVKLYESKKHDVAGADIIRSLEQTLEIKKRCNIKLTKKMEKLKRELAKFMAAEQDLLGKNLWLENELRGGEKALKAYEGKVQALELEIHKLIENKEGLSKQNQTLQSLLRESQIEIENLKKLLRESENREDDQSLRKKLKVLKEKKNALKDELNELQEEKRKAVDQLRIEINELRSTISALRTENGNIKRTLEQLELNNKRLHDERNRLLSESAEIKMKGDELSHLKMKLKKKDQELEELSKKKIHVPAPQILEKIIEVPVEKIVPVNVEKVVPVQKIVEVERPVVIEKTYEVPVEIRDTQHIHYNREAFEMHLARLNRDLEYVTNISNEKAREAEMWRDRFIQVQDNFESEMKLLESRYVNESEQYRSQTEVYRQEITFLKTKLESVQRELSILTQGRYLSGLVTTTATTNPVLSGPTRLVQNMPLGGMNNTFIGSGF